mgnify:CR=1 FL=1
MVRVPFAVEIAKKITNGEVNGNIVTRDGRNARVICWDKKSDSIYNIVALLDEKIMERILTYTINGSEADGKDSDNDLMLEVPEYMAYCDGDVLISGIGLPFIYKKTKGRHGCFSAYFGIDIIGNKFFDCQDFTCDVKGYANEEQRKILIDGLKEIKDPKSKEYLKRFFNIEVKPEYKFKLFDKVLVRDDEEDDWKLAEYSHKTESNQYYVVGGLYWLRCIPYNEQTAHLLGTTDNWEE